MTSIRFSRTLRSPLTRLLIIGLAVLAAATGASADTGGGTIYYTADAWYTMNSDGSSKTALPAGVSGYPSRALHGGARWFLQGRTIPGEFYPSGRPRAEVFAIRGDGLVSVQLTNQPDLENGNLTWMPPGDNLSFIGRRWLLGSVVEGGIYTAQVIYDGAGQITGLSAQPAAPVISNAMVLDGAGYLKPDMASHSWAPAGDRVVYPTYANGRQLWVADLSNVQTLLYSGYSNGPVWSPDGAKIAFENGYWDISTISPDGTGLRDIIKATSTWYFALAKWSPTGSHLAFLGFTHVLNTAVNYDVFRANSNGGNRTNLTNTAAPNQEYPVAWR